MEETEQQRKELEAVLELRLKEWDKFKAICIEQPEEDSFVFEPLIPKSKPLPWLRWLICLVLGALVTYYFLK